MKIQNGEYFYRGYIIRKFSAKHWSIFDPSIDTNKHDQGGEPLTTLINATVSLKSAFQYIDSIEKGAA